MIIRAADAQRTETPAEDAGASVTLPLSDTGGLTQLGAHLVILSPGAGTSARHWHSAEDEIVFVIEGIVTVFTADGAVEIGPGDAGCWPAGIPAPHACANRSDAPATYLVIGARVEGDICHYPDTGRRLVNTPTSWHIEDAQGNRIRGGDLPPHLLGAPKRWGKPADPTTPRILRAAEARPDAATPEQAAYMGAFTARLYSDTGGLTQFGAFTETLEPGARSSDRHWHETEDEFLYFLDGAATLFDNEGAHPLAPGDACAWKSGVANGHHIVNTSDAPCSYIVVGSRMPADTVHYSDLDKLYRRFADGTVQRTRRDGTPL
jgi:uncharacterized cupin superfamily protein